MANLPLKNDQHQTIETVVDSFVSKEKGRYRCGDPGRRQCQKNPALSQESGALPLLLLFGHPEGMTHLVKGDSSSLLPVSGDHQS